MKHWIGSTRGDSWLPLLCCALACLPGAAAAQDLEPRRWTHLPVGTNVLGASYVYTTGDLAFDPVSRIEDAEVELHTAIASYLHTFAIAGTTARVDLIVPVQSGHWDGLVNGEPRSVSRDGLADPTVRLSLNLLGAPALEGEEFMAYREEHATNTVVGLGLGIGIPLGDYMSDKLINLGANRFAIWPQAGVVHTRGPWSFELTGTAFFYTENDDFFNGDSRETDPILAAQAHVVRTLAAGFWVSAGVAWGGGGASKVNGVSLGDDRSTLLYGASFGFPLGRTQSVRLGYFRRESLSEIGASTHNVLASWSIRF